MGRALISAVACAAALAAASPASAEVRHHRWVPPWARVQLPGPPWGARVGTPAGLAFATLPGRGCARAVAATYDFEGNVVARRTTSRCG